MHIKVPTLVIGYLQDSKALSYPGNEGSEMQGRVDVLTSIFRLRWCQVRSGGKAMSTLETKGKEFAITYISHRSLDVESSAMEIILFNYSSAWSQRCSHIYPRAGFECLMPTRVCTSNQDEYTLQFWLEFLIVAEVAHIEVHGNSSPIIYHILSVDELFKVDLSKCLDFIYALVYF